MDKSAGKRAFVTGAAGGLGLAIAKALAAQGVTVAMADVNAPLLELAVQGFPEGRVVPIRCDVADRQALKIAVDSFCKADGLDILVNNAVRFHYAPLVDMPEEEIHRMLDVGLKGVFWSLQAATPHLIKRRGSVVNLSSVAVTFAIGNAAVYSSIKGAVDALTRQQGSRTRCARCSCQRRSAGSCRHTRRWDGDRCERMGKPPRAHAAQAFGHS